MHDLLLAERVNKHFKDTIDGSIAIQRALYFVPAPSVAEDGSVIVPAINPLLQKQANLTSAPIVSCPYTAGRPLLLYVGAISISHNSTAPPAFTGTIRMQDFCVPQYLSRFKISKAAKCYSSGSWWKMLATQPPCPFILNPYWKALTQYWITAGLQTMDSIWSK